MKTDLDYASEKGFDTIWLGVWEHNHNSIAFYEQWGFETFGKHVFRLGNDDQNDLLMKKKIK
jgi:ribosomal protein S18 acetylase RimI-like enzyme